MDECKHTMTQGRKGERGSWCCASAEHGVKAADNWIGYSTDEMGRAYKAQRATKSQGKWRTRFPLIELGMDRGACAHLALQVFGVLPPRSSCWMARA